MNCVSASLSLAVFAFRESTDKPVDPFENPVNIEWVHDVGRTYHTHIRYSIPSIFQLVHLPYIEYGSGWLEPISLACPTKRSTSRGFYHEYQTQWGRPPSAGTTESG